MVDMIEYTFCIPLSLNYIDNFPKRQIDNWQRVGEFRLCCLYRHAVACPHITLASRNFQQQADGITDQCADRANYCHFQTAFAGMPDGDTRFVRADDE